MMKLGFPRLQRPRHAALSEAAQWRLLDMVYAEPAAVWMNLALSLAIGAMTFARMRDLPSAGWACSGVGLAIARIIDWRSYATRRATGGLRHAHRRMIAICSLVGLQWGSGSLVLLLSQDPFLQFWVINALTATLSIAVARMNPVATAIRAQVVLTTAPVAVCCVLTDNVYFVSYAALTLLYMAALLAVVRHLHDQTVRLLIADETAATLLDRETEANARLEAANRRLEAMATTDGLTGIANRRCFDDTLRHTWRHAMRHGTSLSLLLIDVDVFKIYNDALGHQAGDVCLRKIATCVAAAIHRPLDLAARYGGEEFAVIIGDADWGGTVGVAERVRASVECLGLPGPTGSPVTVSIGAAICMPGSGDRAIDIDAEAQGLQALIATADAKLYEAKRAGRNCVRGTAVAGDNGVRAAACVDPTADPGRIAWP